MKRNKITVEIEIVDNSPKVTVDNEITIEDLDKNELIKAIRYLESGGKFLYKCDPSKNISCLKTGCSHNRASIFSRCSMTTSKPYAADDHAYVAVRKGLVRVK